MSTPKLRRLSASLLLILVLSHAGISAADPATTNNPDVPPAEDATHIWLNLQRYFLALDPPPAWRTNRPNAETLANWRLSKAHLAEQLADQSRDFYRQYPNIPETPFARESEYNLLEIVINSGNTNVLPRLQALDKDKISDPTLPPQRKFDLMAHIVERNANVHEAEGVPVVMNYLEKGSRELIKAFPDNPQSWQFLVTVADQEQDPKKSRRLAKEIVSSKADESLKITARRILKRLDHLGKPVALQGTALDGSPIDLSKMKGRVVMLHFWESGCGYCVEELSHVKDVYQKYHDRGLDVVSVSFDAEKENLQKVLALKPLPWPQYLAGPDWDAHQGRDIDIPALPTIWLVDRHGRLSELNARLDLDHKIEHLLKE